jgi:radical SAM superfamily enzyme YgiQ (UPF0313 family)
MPDSSWSNPMMPGASFRADVVLVAPREFEVTRAQRTYREKNLTTFTQRLDTPSFQHHYIRRINEALGLECLAAYLREAGIRVAVINCNVAPHPTNELVRKIRQSGAKVVGISLIYRPQVAEALALVQALENDGEVAVCLGGALASFMFHELLGQLPRLDCIAYGEAEETFRDFASAVVGGTPWKHLPGLAWRDGGRVVVNLAAPPLDLSTLLRPARDTLTYLEAAGYPTHIASLFTSRGCMARCTFCTGKDVYNVERRRTYRFRDPIDVVDEIQYLHQRFGVRFVYFNDDNFLGYGRKSEERVRVLAEELIARRLDVRFATECRVDSLDRELLNLLRRAGMTQVLLGVESGSDAVLTRWRKGATAEENRIAIALVKELGINLEPGFILFDAHTSVEELRDSLRFVQDAGLDRTSFPTYLVNRLSVYPGTEIEKQLVADGTLSRSSIGPGSTTTGTRGGINSILKEFQRLEYSCRDPRSEIAWRCLRQATDPLDHWIEEILPRVTALLLDTRKRHSDVERRSLARDLLRRAARWRREVGRLVTEYMQICVDSYDRQPGPVQMRWLRRSLCEARLRYERFTLGMPGAEFLVQVDLISSGHEQHASIGRNPDGGEVVATAADPVVVASATAP